MKYLLIEIENASLKISNVNCMGNNMHFEKTKICPLPESIINDVSLSDINAFSNFVFENLIKGGFKRQKAIVLLYDSSILMKEFTHPKASADDLIGLVSIEAENILPGGIDGYIVKSADYGNRPDVENQYKGAIYAVKKSYIDNLEKALSKIGLNILKITPFIDSYTNIFKLLLDEKIMPPLKGKTVAAIHFESKKCVISVFANKIPVFQRISNSASHIIDNIIMETLNVTIDEAKEYKMTKGLLFNPNDKESEVNLNARITKITHSMIEDIIRSVRLTLSVARLELESIVITGGFSFMPGLPEHVEEITGVKCARINEYKDKINSLIKINNSKDNTTDLANFVGMAGANFTKAKNSINFLPEKGKKNRESVFTVFICTVIVFLLLIIMAYEPYVYFQAQKEKTELEETLKKDIYVTTRQKLAEITNLKNQLAQLSPENIGIPKDNSVAGNSIEKISSYLTANLSLISYSYDYNKKTLTLRLITKRENSNEINLFKDNINKSGIYTISNNINTSLDELSNIYTYEVEIKII